MKALLLFTILTGCCYSSKPELKIRDLKIGDCLGLDGEQGLKVENRQLYFVEDLGAEILIISKSPYFVSKYRYGYVPRDMYRVESNFCEYAKKAAAS